MSFAHSRLLVPVILVSSHLSGVTALRAQTFHSPEYSRQLVNSPPLPAQLPGPEGLRDYVSDGKLRLKLDDAVRLALLNNSDVRINQLQIDQARYNVLGAYQPFAPSLISSFNSTRTSAPATNQLQGASTPTALNQAAQFSYSQTFQTGTVTSYSFSGSKSDTNSSFYFINPYLSSLLSLQVTQPLLRNRGLFPNRAPLVIARRNLEQSRQVFESQVNNSISQVVGQYWSVVAAREGLKIDRASLQQAEASYQHDKRALELGALPPLDIYRSESQVAQRRVQVIQSEYTLKQAEDRLRQVIGADLDPYIQALDLELDENPEPQGELLTTDAKTELGVALKRRPEMEAARQQLAIDDTAVRLAHNNLLPDLSLAGFYSSTGIGGNTFNSATPPALVARGGFGDALSQVFGFGFPTYGFTLTLNLPIKNPSAAANLGRASVAKRGDLYALRRQEQTITLDVLNAVHGLEEAKLSMAAAKISRDLAQKNLEAEQRKHELGSETIFFVLEAQTELATAELSLVQAEINYRLAVTGVERATGALLDHHRVEIADLTR